MAEPSSGARHPGEPRQPSGSHSAASLAETPLAGLTFLNPRAAEDAAALTAPLVRLGGTVLERPMLAYDQPQSWDAFDQRLGELSARDWIAFTSATAVRFTIYRLQSLGLTVACLTPARLAAVGEGTARALASCNLKVDLVPPPEEFQAEGLLRALLQRLRAGERVWLPRAEQGREALAEGLLAAGIAVQPTPAYRTIVPPGGLGPALDLLRAGRVDWLIFTSSSSVRHFMAMVSDAGLAWAGSAPEGLTQPRVACLGRITAQTAADQGLAVHVVPRRQDLPGLISAIVDAVAGRGAQPA
jgi:uroporphyrinogen-III synthase